MKKLMIGMVVFILGLSPCYATLTRPGLMNPLSGTSPQNEISLSGTRQTSSPNLRLAVTREIGGGKMNVVGSALVPGLGLWRVSGSPLFLVLAPICYGTVGVGTMRYLGGQKDYRSYMDTKNPIEQDEFLESANNKRASGIKMLAGGLALWVIQTGWTYIWGSYNDLYRSRNANWTDKIAMLPTIDLQTQSLALTTTLKF
jgi:hypothetical protein